MSTFPRHDLDLLYLYKKPEDIRDFLKDNPHLQKYNVEKTHDVLIWALDHLFRARNNQDDYARSLEFFKELAAMPWPRKSLKRLVDQSFDLGVFDHLAGFNIKNLDLNFRKKLLEKNGQRPEHGGHQSPHDPLVGHPAKCVVVVPNRISAGSSRYYQSLQNTRLTF